MKKTLVILVAALALATAYFAIRGAGETRAVKAALAAAVAQRDALDSRVAELAKENATLASQLDELRAATSAAPAPAADQGPRAFAAAAPRGRLAGPLEAMDSPEMRQLMAITQKGRLDSRYAALFKALHLRPEQLDGLKQLLVDKENAPLDVLAAARDQDVLDGNSARALRQLIQQQNQEIDSAIHELLGDTAYEEYQDYERTAGERRLVDELASRLSYSDAPLTSEQTAALIDVLAAARAVEPADPASSVTARPAVRFSVSSGDAVFAAGAGPLGGVPGPAIADTSIAAAEGLLSETQLAALRQLQAEQQAQQQMAEMFRRSLPPPGEGGTIRMGRPPEAAPVPRP